MSENNVQDQKSSKKVHLVYLLVILFLGGGAGYLGFMYKTATDQLMETKVVLTETSSQKDSLLFQLDSVYMEFEALKSDNDSINKQIETQQSQIKNLYYQLKKAKNGNRAEIDKYKEELVSLQEILKAKYRLIDSLNSVTVFLTEENTRLQGEMETARKVDEEKTAQLEQLSEKVEKAAVLKAFNMTSIPLSRKSKPSFKKKKVSKIKTSCTIGENAVVDPGTVTVYVRITRNDGAVLSKANTNTFTYDGEEILYSEKRDIDYQNKDTKFEIFYEPTQDELMSGAYKVLLFARGKEIGNTNFVLR